MNSPRQGGSYIREGGKLKLQARTAPKGTPVPDETPASEPAEAKTPDSAPVVKKRK